MKFSTDKQTIDDLNIFPKTKGDLSFFNFYDLTQTKGGKNELENMLKNPSNDLELIKTRLSTIKFILDKKIRCKLQNEYPDFIEYYLNQNTPILKDNFLSSLSTFINYKIKPNNEYYIILKGLESIKNHLLILSRIFAKINELELPDFFKLLKVEIESILKSPEFKHFINPENGKLSFQQVNHYDHLVRSKKMGGVKRILKLTYQLDVYLSVANTTKKHNLGFPKVTKELKPHLKMEGFFHPFIKNPVKNNVSIIDNKNFCFVSGANMAGKSTFLKTVGIGVYLSHVGFPVPARVMEVSLFNGLFTTINISDDINKGYSHYYSEVRRVKDIALMIKEKNKVLVIFDELFRGTNVKDAFDATLIVSKGFSEIKTSLFFISTHIVEVGQELEKLKNIELKCFESTLKGDQPVYNYKLSNGISTERLGLTILKNEKIMEIINEVCTGLNPDKDL